MKVLITGPTSAVGQYVLEALMQTEHEVRVLALPDSMHRVLFRDRIEMVPGELSDPLALAEAVAGVERVFHCAFVGPPFNSEARIIEVNAAGTEHLLRACAGRVDRFVMVSSAEIYQDRHDPQQWPISDATPARAPDPGPEGARVRSLVAAERAVTAAAERDGLDYAILRPTTVAGRKCREIEEMITDLIRRPESAMATHHALGALHWSHGKDVAAAALLVAEHRAARNQCFLVAGPETVTVLDVQSAIWQLMNIGRPANPYAELALQANPAHPKYVPRKLAAIGWEPRVSLLDCVGEVLARLEFYSSASIQLPEHMLS